MRRRDELKKEVKIMLSNRNMKQLEQLEIIDNLQRLGLCYHFEDEIYSILNNLSGKTSKRDHLYAKALEFRLLRQHGFNISQGALIVVSSFFPPSFPFFLYISCIRYLKFTCSINRSLMTFSRAS